MSASVRQIRESTTSSATAAQEAGSGAGEAVRGSLRKEAFVAAVVVLAHLPLLCLLIVELWNRPNSEYRFLPFLLVGVALLFWRRWPRRRGATPIRGSRLETMLLIGGLVMLTGAAVASCRWLAVAASIITCGGLLLHFAGAQNQRRLFGSWMLLWLAIPAATGWDAPLLRSFHVATAEAGGSLLEFPRFGFLNRVHGSTLELPGRAFRVEEVCGGFLSLFTLLSCAGLLAVFRRRSRWRGCALLLSAPVWTLAVSTLYFLAIAKAAADLDLELYRGTARWLSGTVFFAFGLAMISSTDAALGLLKPIRRGVSAAARRVRRGLRAVAKLFRRKSAPKASEPSEAGKTMKRRRRKPKRSRSRKRASRKAWLLSPPDPSRRGPLGSWRTAGFALCLGLIQLWNLSFQPASALRPDGEQRQWSGFQSTMLSPPVPLRDSLLVGEAGASV